MTDHRIPMPVYAKTFLAGATRTHTERVMIVIFHRWLMVERCMELSAVSASTGGGWGLIVGHRSRPPHQPGPKSIQEKWAG